MFLVTIDKTSAAGREVCGVDKSNSLRVEFCIFSPYEFVFLLFPISTNDILIAVCIIIFPYSELISLIAILFSQRTILISENTVPFPP